MSDKTLTKKPVGNKTTEVLIGGAASKLSAAAVSITSAINSIETMEEKCEELSLIIVNREERITELDQLYKQKEETLKFELELQAKQYPEMLLQSYLNNTNQVAVSTRKYQELVAVEKDFQINLSTIKSTLEKDLRTDFQNQLETEKLKGVADTAVLKAELQQKESEIKFYRDSISRLEKEVEAGRALTQSVAEAGKIGAINIPTGK